MRYTLFRILKHGLLAAVILAVMGYMLAEIAGVWVSAQPSARPGTAPVPLGNELKGRLPFTLAGWGFGVILMYELVLHLLRGGKAPPTAAPASAVTSDSDVERLLNELMQQAEAAEAARKQSLVETPPPSSCLTPAPADNSPVPNRG